MTTGGILDIAPKNQYQERVERQHQPPNPSGQPREDTMIENLLIRLLRWFGAEEIPVEAAPVLPEPVTVPPERIGQGGGTRDPFAQYPENVNPTLGVDGDGPPPVTLEDPDVEDDDPAAADPQIVTDTWARAMQPRTPSLGVAATEAAALVTVHEKDEPQPMGDEDEPPADDSLDGLELAEDPINAAVLDALAETPPNGIPLPEMLRKAAETSGIYDGMWDDSEENPITHMGDDGPPVGFAMASRTTAKIVGPTRPQMAVVEITDEDGDDGPVPEPLPLRDEPELDAAIAMLREESRLDDPWFTRDGSRSFSPTWRFNLVPKRSAGPVVRPGFMAAFAAAMVMFAGWFIADRLGSSPKGEGGEVIADVGTGRDPSTPASRVDVGAYAADPVATTEPTQPPVIAASDDDAVATTDTDDDGDTKESVAEVPSTPSPSPPPRVTAVMATPAPVAASSPANRRDGKPTLVPVPPGTQTSHLTGWAAQREIDRRLGRKSR